jgi:hypothetical protein
LQQFEIPLPTRVQPDIQSGHVTPPSLGIRR